MSDPGREFAEESRRNRRSLVAELGGLVLSTKKYWMIPLLLLLLVLSLVLVLGQTALGPFIYTIF